MPPLSTTEDPRMFLLYNLRASAADAGLYSAMDKVLAVGHARRPAHPVSMMASSLFSAR